MSRTAFFVIMGPGNSVSICIILSSVSRNNRVRCNKSPKYFSSMISFFATLQNGSMHTVFKTIMAVRVKLLNICLSYKKPRETLVITRAVVCTWSHIRSPSIQLPISSALSQIKSWWYTAVSRSNFLTLDDCQENEARNIDEELSCKKKNV